ncbi:LysM peptidoglycan-binding domain-containing protein, partial [Kutzneria sp. 744]|uniref:LysM peptidoglycan-binding domain-containing protein n=1 Tax=Kutzneria sp. (strain 744) TaxID=345341 RepID=UPI0003EEB17B
MTTLTRPRAAQVATALAALCGMAVFAVGLPIANVMTGGQPQQLLPTTWPDLSDPDLPSHMWQALRWFYLDGHLIPWLTHVMLWCAWGIGVCCILADLYTVARAGSTALRRRLQTSTPRTWITSVVATALILASTSTAHATPGSGARPVATAPQHPVRDNHSLAPALVADEPVVSPKHSPFFLDDSVHPSNPRVTVVRGDTYWGLADHHLGDGRRYVDIEALNRDRVPDPRVLLPGTILLLPPDATDLPTRADDPGPGAYQVTVRVGQSLADIACSHQVTGGWQRLWEINRNRLQPDGRALRAPALILPGWHLWIPAPPPSTAPVAPPVVPPAASTSPPALAPPPQAPRTTGGPSAPNATYGHSPSDTASPGHEVITLPSGGIVGLGFAGLITIALAVVRLRRRRHRHVTGTLHPPTPTPAVPPAVALLDTACRAPDPTQPPDEAHTDPGTPRRSWPPPAPMLTTHDDSGTTATVDLTTVPGLGLTGPGASAAARAALIALLAADTLHPTELLIVADTATFLADGIGTAPAADGAAVADHVALGMTCVPTLDEAIAMVEAELARRTRLLDEHTLHATNPPDTAGENTADPDTPVADRFATYRASDPGEPVPTYLVIASPPPAMAPRWLAVLEL